MNIQRILFPYTGVDEESDLLVQICRYARAVKASVTVLQVVEVPLSLPEDAPSTALPKMEEAHQLLECAELIARRNGIQVEVEVMQAREVGPGIVRAAESLPADLLVVAGVRSAHHPDEPMGETIGYLIRNAPCPIWIGCQPNPNGKRELEG
ncbi:universal stress protein [bacterium CPR1]|nr:universal stress protein [bacterium CPR1]